MISLIPKFQIYCISLSTKDIRLKAYSKIRLNPKYFNHAYKRLIEKYNNIL